MSDSKKKEKRDIKSFLKNSHWPFFVLLATVFFSWGAWGLVIKETSPFASESTVVPLFYITFFFAVSTSFALFGTFVRFSFFRNRSLARSINIAIRQGIILASAISIALLFQDFRVLTWWNAALLLIMCILIEISLNKE